MSGLNVSRVSAPRLLRRGLLVTVCLSFALFAGDNLVVNGHFSDSLNAWHFSVCCGANASIGVEGGQCQASVEDAGEEFWTAQLVQGGIRIVQGLTYTLRFEARAANERFIEAVVETDGEPWALYSRRRVYKLTPELYTYEHTFTMDSVSDVDARIAFNFGKDTGLAVIDNIELFQHNSRFELVNGDFAGVQPYEPLPPVALYGWDTRICCGARADIDASSGACEVEIGNIGPAPWAIQLMQRGLHVHNGEDYTLFFEARATSHRTIDVVVETDGAPWTNYGDARSYYLTSEMQTYSHPFTMRDSTDPAARLTFNLGGEIGDVVIDNVTLVSRTMPLYSLTVRGGGDWFGPATGTGMYPGGFPVYIHGGTPPREGMFWTWTGDTGYVDDPSSELTTVVMPDHPISVNALPSPSIRFDFSVNGEGTIVTDPAGERGPGEVDRYFPQGAIVEIQAEAAEGNVFSHWSGDFSGIDNPLTVTVDFHRSLTAHFVEDAQNLVVNGSFAAGADCWLLYEMEGGQADASVHDGECEITITNPGAAEWALQFFQKGIAIEQGARYRLSFRARASAPREIRAHVQKNGWPWNSYSSGDGLPTTIALSTEWEERQIDFVMENPTDSNARVMFEFGLENPAVYLDNVRLIQE